MTENNENNQENIKSNIDDKLAKVKYVADDVSHLIPDQAKCLLCTSKACTYFCPAKVYEWDEANQKLIVGYENCLECGACRIACEKKCIEWEYPKGNKGVTFKHG